MDTSGKIATGVAVPLGVIGLAVGGYFLLRRSKKPSVDHTQSPVNIKKIDEELDVIQKQIEEIRSSHKAHGNIDNMSEAISNLEELLSNTKGGKRRRLTRRRR
jgi:hypothetical protein